MKCHYTCIKTELPSPSGGGTSQAVLDRIAALEQKIEQLEGKKATDSEYGLARISESSSVTETGAGLVLGAKEKNAAITGTIAHGMSALGNKAEQAFDLASTSIQFENYGYTGADSEKIVNLAGNAVFLFILSNSYNQSCVWIVQTGVSVGTSKITGILTSEYFSLEPNGIASVKFKTHGADGILKSILIGWN